MWSKYGNFTVILVADMDTENPVSVLSGEECQSEEEAFQSLVDECEQFAERFRAAMT
jgi:hypothetical protein